MRNLNEVLKGISRFILYWEKLSDEDSKGKYHRRNENLCYYWRAVKDVLLLLIETMAMLCDGFWPIMQFALASEDQFVEDGSIQKKYNEDDHFVGQRQDCPTPSF
jgi:hypothetical protein